MRRIFSALLTLWGATKNATLEPTLKLGQKLQWLNRAFLLQLGLNMGAFVLFSVLLQLTGWFSTSASLFLAYVLGYLPEAIAEWKARKQYPGIGDYLRWICGALAYIAAKAVLNQQFPIGSWESCAGEWWMITLWQFTISNLGFLLLHLIIASGLGYAGELSWVWLNRRFELLKKR